MTTWLKAVSTWIKTITKTISFSCQRTGNNGPFVEGEEEWGGRENEVG